MWVKKEKVPVIHYLQFVFGLQINCFEIAIAYKIKRVQAKHAIFRQKARIYHEYVMNFTSRIFFYSGYACS